MISKENHKNYFKILMKSSSNLIRILQISAHFLERYPANFKLLSAIYLLLEIIVVVLFGGDI